MGAALVDANGKVREFKDFKREAEAIAGEQLKWLKTEYDTAIAGAQMAAKWLEIQASKDAFPLLQFDAVIDSHTSQICHPLNGVIRPVDDDFWKKYYPPNHFNCRSTVRQLRSGDITPLDKITYPENLPEMFKINVGITGIIFPPGHAYYTDVPAHVINNATLYMPVADQYIIKYKSADGIELAVNRKTDVANGSDLQQLIAAGRTLADKGFTVDILPEIHASEVSLRDALLKGAQGAKNPDLLINGDYYAEVKTPETPLTDRKLRNNISAASKQADTAIIVLQEEYSIERIKVMAADQFKAHPDMERIAFVTTDGEYLEYLNDGGR